jgi:hypothetical protein
MLTLQHSARNMLAAAARKTVVAAAPALLVRPFAAQAAAAPAAGRRFPGPITHNQHTKHMTAGVGQVSTRTRQ